MDGIHSHSHNGQLWGNLKFWFDFGMSVLWEPWNLAKEDQHVSKCVHIIVNKGIIHLGTICKAAQSHTPWNHLQTPFDPNINWNKSEIAHRNWTSSWSECLYRLSETESQRESGRGWQRIVSVCLGAMTLTQVCDTTTKHIIKVNSKGCHHGVAKLLILDGGNWVEL